MVGAVGVAAAYSFTAQERYESQADVLVTPISGADDTFLGIGVLREGVESRSVLTAARLIQTPQVADAVAEQLDGELGRDQLLASIEVEPLQQSNIVTITAEADSAATAAEIANAFAEEMIDQRTIVFQRELEATLERLQDRLDTIPASQRDSGEAVAIQERIGGLSALVGARDPTLQISSQAVPSSEPSWPKPTLAIAVAFLAALLLGTGAAIGLELANPRVNREDELLLVQRLPVLARIPRMRRKHARRYLTGREALPGDVRESYRILRASLASAGTDGGYPRSVLVTSAVAGEGKTMTSVNLAVTLSLAGMRVVLVDGDLRRPMVATVFGVPSRRHGFAHVLVGEVGVDEALVSAPGHGGNLQLLLASPEHEHVIDLLDPSRIQRVLEQLGDVADVAVVDSPPLTEVADALNLAAQVDAVLVAVSLGKTRRDKLNQLRRMLAQRDVAPLGFVVTNRRRSRRGGYYYGAAPTSRERERKPRRGRSEAPAVRFEHEAGPAREEL